VLSRRAPARSGRVRARPLPDRIGRRPRILFVGINPGLRSGAVGHHFAGPGNPFWRLLHAARLVPEPLTWADDRRLPEWGLAVTNIVDRPTRQAAEITPAEVIRGRRRLALTITRTEPGVVAFVGSTVYRWFFGNAAGGGCGPKPERIGTCRVFVVPNPSGRNAAYPGFRDKLVWFRRLARFDAARRASGHSPRGGR
jgi:double-stranded uracil-DNA glycosylase